MVVKSGRMAPIFSNKKTEVMYSKYIPVPRHTDNMIWKIWYKEKQQNVAYLLASLLSHPQFDSYHLLGNVSLSSLPLLSEGTATMSDVKIHFPCDSLSHPGRGDYYTCCWHCPSVRAPPVGIIEEVQAAFREREKSALPKGSPETIISR